MLKTLVAPVRKGQDPPIQFGQIPSLAGVFGVHFWEKETTVTLSIVDNQNLGCSQPKRDRPNSKGSRGSATRCWPSNTANPDLQLENDDVVSSENLKTFDMCVEHTCGSRSQRPGPAYPI